MHARKQLYMQTLRGLETGYCYFHGTRRCAHTFGRIPSQSRSLVHPSSFTSYLIALRWPVQSNERGTLQRDDGGVRTVNQWGFPVSDDSFAEIESERAMFMCEQALSRVQHKRDAIRSEAIQSMIRSSQRSIIRWLFRQTPLTRPEAEMVYDMRVAEGFYSPQWIEQQIGWGVVEAARRVMRLAKISPIVRISGRDLELINP